MHGLQGAVHQLISGNDVSLLRVSTSAQTLQPNAYVSHGLHEQVLRCIGLLRQRLKGRHPHLFSFLYSGERWYFANSCSHSSCGREQTIRYCKRKAGASIADRCLHRLVQRATC